MVQIRRYFLALSALSLGIVAATSSGPKFYSDDPIARMPPPLDVKSAKPYTINELYDFVIDSLATPGKPKSPADIAPARAVNTLGEVPDSSWYTNRHYWHRMSLEELKRGPARHEGPVTPLRVVSMKTVGVTPGFVVADARGDKYVLKSDPLSNPEMSSAADVIGSKFFYALGYNVPENYVAYFRREELQLEEKAKMTRGGGRTRAIKPEDLDKVLERVPRGADGRYRVMASFFIPGKILGPFDYYGTRSDDPNDIVPHQDRGDLRGLYVFAAWLNHTDAKSGNSLDSLVEENGVHYIRHYLIDFGAALGSDSDMPKNPRFGHQYMIDKSPAVLSNMLSLGFYIPRWETAHFPDIPAVGHFDAATFQPDKWTSNYPNPAFLRHRPEDAFWAAKQVMAFTDEEIRAMVETGSFSDPGAAEYITRTLIERRDKIGRVFFAQVLPLDRFEIRDGQLVFSDLAVKYNIAPKSAYRFTWSRFDNQSRTKTALAEETTAALPHDAAGSPPGSYWAADITAGDAAHALTVYVRKAKDGFVIVGIDRGSVAD